MKTIVCGSRDFADYALLKRVLDKLLKPYLGKGLVLLSGGASGADKLGERWAFENLVAYRVYHPAWAKCGKAAGMLRNQEMVDDAEACIAFWDGKSKGTADTIRRARAAKLKLKVVNYGEKGTSGQHGAGEDTVGGPSGRHPAGPGHRHRGDRGGGRGKGQGWRL